MKTKLIWNVGNFVYENTNEGLLIDPEDVFEDFLEDDDNEEKRIYRYWDGRNWKTVFCENETEIVISDSYVDLDEWDGRNFLTGGVGLHEKVYRVYEVDGEKVADTFMVLYSSQWQGDHNSAEVLHIDELKEHLKEIDRDLDEYIPQILAIK